MASINVVTKGDSLLFEESYDKLICCIREEIPVAKSFIQSILPVNNKDYSISCNNAQIVNCNTIISKLSAKYGLMYIDLYSEYEHDVMLNCLSKDGIHLTSNAYN